MAKGGARPGGGLKLSGDRLEFREFVKSVLTNPEVRQNILETAKNDANFALRLWHSSYGYPKQYVEHSGPDGPLRYVVQIAGGGPFPAEAAGVPASGTGEPGEG